MTNQEGMTRQEERRKILEKLVFYGKDCISGRTAHSREWDKEINQALTALDALDSSVPDRKEIEKAVSIVKDIITSSNDETEMAHKLIGHGLNSICKLIDLTSVWLSGSLRKGIDNDSNK